MSIGRTLAILIISLFVLASNAEETRPLQLLNDPMAFDMAPGSNAVNLELRIRNETNVSVPVMLSVSDFRSRTTDKNLGAVCQLFVSATSNALPDSVDLDAGKVLSVRAEIKNLWQAGEAEAQVLNGVNSIGTLRMVRDRVPFNVKLFNTSSNGEIMFLYDKSAFLDLTNGDPLTYQANWRLRIGAEVIDGTNLVLPPNSTVEIEMEPKDGWFDKVAGVFKDEVKDAILTISYRPKSAEDSPNWPQIGLPFKAHLQYVSTLRSYVPIFGVLVLGACCSLFLYLWVPNEIQRSDVQEVIDDLETRIRAVSRRVDSAPRVIADVEVSRVERQIGLRNPWSADLPKDLDVAQKQLTALAPRADLLIKIDALYGKIDKSDATLAAPFLEQATACLHNAEEILAAVQLSDAELDTAKKEVENAQGWLDEADAQRRSLVDDLASQFKELTTAFAVPQAGADPYSAYRTPLSAFFTALANIANNLGPNTSAVRLAELYIVACSLDLLRKFVALANPPPDAAIKGFISALQHKNCEGLQTARSLICALDGQPAADIIAQAIMNREVSIETGATIVRANESVPFRVRFKDNRFNARQTRELITVHWEFGHDGLWEDGWEVAHYYPKGKYSFVEMIRRARAARRWEFIRQPRRYVVQASFRNNAGEVKDAQGNTATIGHEVDVMPSDPSIGQRARVEMIKLVVALLIAVLGLIAGAREQFLKLDLGAGLVAVFLLGFSADSIKNLLTRK